MKLGIALALAAASLVMAVTIQLRPLPRGAAVREQRFQVRGEVRELDVQGKSIRIKHEAIPDYMAAMTMPFSVPDSSCLRGLHVGDEVGFELVVTKDDSWIAAIHRFAETSPSPSREAASDPERDVQRVQVGEVVPDFVLTDQNNRAVALRDLRGKAVLLTFVYTRCPLPNFCPLMAKNFASLQERLEKQFPGRFHLLTVSIDPEFDRPEVLKDYAARYTTNGRTWSFATGTAEQSDRVGALFGLVQERKDGLINHDLRTALIGPDGRLVHVWKSNVWTPYEVQRRVEAVLSPGG